MSRTFWFSPVPPSRTDIAQYSARIVPHLSSRIELQVLHPGAAQGDGQLGAQPMAGVSPRALNASWSCLYNIGNNPVFHGEILHTARRHPGVVVLHDRSLQDLCHAVLDREAADNGGMASYAAAMAHWYGRPGREAARAVHAGDATISSIAGDFPLFEVALQGALGAVTHNPLVADEISERFPGMPVATLPLPYSPPAEPAPGPPQLTPDRPIRLVMFGYLNPNRRLCEFLRAWAQSPWKHRFELDLAGEMNNGPEVRSAIAEAGLGERVRDHGFLPDDRLDALIRQAHLVLNLRNPTMGEASGSQLRIWANGAASVVSGTGWYRQLPQGSVLQISTEREHEDLLALLDDLAEGRIDPGKVARRGAQCLSASDPALYAAALAEWLVERREAMFAHWSETALIEATARNYAACTPPRFIPRLPDRLLG
ncbi:glycosyltransferase family 4 protein [Novosphingobium olei]|uniref:Glycosyltransferase family 4 protein n=1 Tax=Novosphingobium olei TaxID=2728851 RepID=A0A7Y0G7S2_9SPHN|nr:glycosyltransferase family 4 protein [Novosphingobium olei]NML92241.1 glycosyltransferase family 4 protein [Novosphingobium olei]